MRLWICKTGASYVEAGATNPRGGKIRRVRSPELSMESKNRRTVQICSNHIRTTTLALEVLCFINAPVCIERRGRPFSGGDFDTCFGVLDASSYEQIHSHDTEKAILQVQHLHTYCLP